MSLTHVPRLTPPQHRSADAAPAARSTPASPFVVELVGQQVPPREGYSIKLFRQYLEAMETRLDQMRRDGDFRAPFQLTYLSFSRRVFAALTAGRFRDEAWATDMCCRFIEVYLQQLERWDLRHPGLCRPWRIAFESMEEGRVNPIQAMLLGMNAHIHYDLAFVTLGACRFAGDLPDSLAGRSLSASRSGVPTVRYHDFLVINQVGWESIPHIQDAVLSAFNRALYWANRVTLYATRYLGQRIFIEARDTSWTQTTLLIHARNTEERSRVARVIDAYAASISDLIGGMTWRPDRVLESAGAWLRRWERIDPDVQGGLLQMAIDNPVIAELALRELAFAGAEPVAIIETLLAHEQPLLAGAFGQLVLRNAPVRRRQRLLQYLMRDTAAPVALEAVEAAGALPEPVVKSEAMARLKERREQRFAHVERALADPRVARHPALTQALRAQAVDLKARLGNPRPGAARAALSTDVFLRHHSDRWVRACAAQALFPGESMPSVIERVLFLKETPLFMEVDPGVLVHLADKLEPRAFKPGELLVRAGAQHGGLHVIRRGDVSVSQERGGKTVSIVTLHAKDTVGELSALNDTPPTADCRAAGEVETFFMPAEVLSQLLHQHPRLAIGLIRMLSQRLMETTRQLTASA